MSTKKELNFQLGFVAFLIKVAQKHNFSRLQRQIILQRFGQQQGLNEIHGNNNISPSEYQLALKDICSKLRIIDAPSVSREDNLRSYLLVDFQELMGRTSIGVQIDRAIESGASSVRGQIKHLQNEVRAYELYHSLLESLKTETSVFSRIEIVSSFILELNLEAEELDYDVFSHFLAYLPSIITHFAATSSYTEKQVMGLVVEQLANSVIHQATIADVEQPEFTPVVYFVSRYTILLHFESAITAEEILAQAYQQIDSALRLEVSAENFVSLLRLNAYLILQDLLQRETWTTHHSVTKMQEVSRALEQKIETELKDEWNSFERLAESDTSAECVCSVLDTIKLAKQYLTLSVCIEQWFENQNQLLEILKLSGKNGLLAFLMSRIDCLVFAELQNQSAVKRNLLNEKTVRQFLDEASICGDSVLRVLNSPYSQISTAISTREKKPFYLRSLLIACLSGAGVCLAAFAGFHQFRSICHNHNNAPSQYNSGLTVSGFIQPSQTEQIDLHLNQVQPVRNSNFSTSPIVREQGLASWSGQEYQDRPTASGELFDRQAPTASHHSLAIGTVVLVTSKSNPQGVTVRINDRLEQNGRIINLSESVAQALGIRDAGVAPVQIRTISR